MPLTIGQLPAGHDILGLDVTIHVELEGQGVGCNIFKEKLQWKLDKKRSDIKNIPYTCIDT